MSSASQRFSEPAGRPPLVILASAIHCTGRCVRCRRLAYDDCDSCPTCEREAAAVAGFAEAREREEILRCFRRQDWRARLGRAAAGLKYLAVTIFLALALAYTGGQFLWALWQWLKG